MHSDTATMSAFGLTDLSPAKGDLSQGSLEAAVSQISEVLLGKEESIRLAITCLIAGGHLLIEDIPGVGKTTLAHALARTMGLSFHRIQFTSDLLPADILGVSVYERESGTFQFHPGPIFAQLVLADEVNRATPRAQSALLEAMEEQQVTQEGETRPLPEPFFVIATQNPSHQVGTFPLPESQLDRFLMRIELGYPDAAAERNLLQGRDRRELLAGLDPRLEPELLLGLRAASRDIHVSEALLDYVQALVAYSRETPEYVTGLSPRAAIALVKSTQARALLEGRSYAVPEDLQAVLPSVAGHRLRLASGAGASSSGVTRSLIDRVPIP